jgi:16S rRNA (adenine1518-N6/adenine1519-N6)-dimethyltransferase
MTLDETSSAAQAVLQLPSLRHVIESHEIFTKKSLGQHFLLDLNLTRRIARAAGDLKNATTIEIGPGPGGLTRALLIEGAGRVIAIEKDRRCIQALQPLVAASHGRLTLLEADALEADIASLGEGRPITIVANLPYNVGTPLLFNWLEKLDGIQQMTLMFQKEVAERIVAAPHSKDYGRLAVMSQWLCRTRKEFDIPAQAFFPPPKVTSTVISLFPKGGVDRSFYPQMEFLCQKLFGQRRKMLRVSLKQVTDAPEALLSKCGISGELRPENLSVDQFVAMARLCA